MTITQQEIEVARKALAALEAAYTQQETYPSLRSQQISGSSLLRRYWIDCSC